VSGKIRRSGRRYLVSCTASGDDAKDMQADAVAFYGVAGTPDTFVRGSIVAKA